MNLSYNQTSKKGLIINSNRASVKTKNNFKMVVGELGSTYQLLKIKIRTQFFSLFKLTRGA